MADFNADTWTPVPGEDEVTSRLRFHIEREYCDDLDVDIEEMLARTLRRVEMRKRAAELASRPCSRCGVVKHPLAFSEHVRDGRMSICKECNAHRQRAARHESE